MIEKKEVAEAIKELLLNGHIEKNGSFATALRRVATWNIPWVDFAFQDITSEKTVGCFFPSEADEDVIKSNAVKVISTFDSCIICFHVSCFSTAYSFMQSEKADLGKLPVGIIVYDDAHEVLVQKSFSISKNEAFARSKKEMKSYWCWWRDASQYEVATLLRLSKKYTGLSDDIYTDYVYPEFFDLMISGKTKQWDGSPRRKSYSFASYKSEKQNYKIPMCQLGLWYADDGELTLKGNSLLQVAETYGDNSKDYLDCLSKIILIDGKHLELIKDLEEFQRNNRELIPETSTEFFVLFDEYMINKNSVGTRKPTAITTGAKKAYIRDEPKLWNKLGIIKLRGSNRYYIPFTGIEFDWNKINEILLTKAWGKI